MALATSIKNSSFPKIKLFYKNFETRVNASLAHGENHRQTIKQKKKRKNSETNKIEMKLAIAILIVTIGLVVNTESNIVLTNYPNMVKAKTRITENHLTLKIFKLIPVLAMLILKLLGLAQLVMVQVHTNMLDRENLLLKSRQLQLAFYLLCYHNL